MTSISGLAVHGSVHASTFGAVLFAGALTWATFYFACFVVGFALTLVSFLAGTAHMHLPARLHVPQIGHHAAGQSGAGMRLAGKAAHAGIPIINFSTLVAFLAWFGGTGYLLTHYGQAQVVVGLIVAVVGGLTGASIVFWFLVKLMSYEHPLDPADYDLVGVIARVNIPIRDNGGTGEVVYSLAGTRRASGARSDDASAISKGAEVVITRYERGIAYVKPWEEFAGEPEEEHSTAGS